MKKDKYIVYAWPHGDNVKKRILKRFDTPEEQEVCFSNLIHKSPRTFSCDNYGKCLESEFKETFE